MTGVQTCALPISLTISGSRATQEPWKAAHRDLVRLSSGIRLSTSCQRQTTEGPRPSRTTDWRRAVVVTRHGAATYIGPSFTCNIFVGGCSNCFQLLAEPMKVIYPTCDLEVNAYEHRVHTRMTIRFLAIIKPVSPLRHQRYRERHGHSNRTDIEDRKSVV